MSRQDAVTDILAVGGACVAYLVFGALQVPKRWSYLAMGLVLAVYAIHVRRRGEDSWHGAGFRSDNILAALVPIGVGTLIAAVALVGVAMWRGKSVWETEVLVLLSLYPVWALAQQLAFQGLLHRGLMEVVRSPVLEVLITAVAFACVHFGSPVLMALTFAAGVGWSLLYRRWPNLWLLAGSHTVLAALAYPLILSDDPLSRF